MGFLITAPLNLLENRMRNKEEIFNKVGNLAHYLYFSHPPHPIANPTVNSSLENLHNNNLYSSIC